MEASYITIYKLLGVTKLPSDVQTFELVELPNFNANVILTTNPDRYCVDIDRSRASMLCTEQNGTQQERLAAQIEKVRRERVDLYGTGVFLLFEAREDIDAPDFTIRRDLVDVAICFDASLKKVLRALRAKLAPAVHGVLTAMALGIAEIGA